MKSIGSTVHDVKQVYFFHRILYDKNSVLNIWYFFVDKI